MAIKSVSAWAHTRQDITTMVDWTADKLKALGTTIELADVGMQTMPDGSKLALPKVILGILGNVRELFLLCGKLLYILLPHFYRANKDNTRFK